jgi:hypothetical protein
MFRPQKTPLSRRIASAVLGPVAVGLVPLVENMTCGGS